MKPWYLSKTIIFNLAASIVAFVAAALPQMQSLMTPKMFVLFSIAVGITNVVLRFVTTQSIGKDGGS